MPQHIEPNETREQYLERAKDWAVREFRRRTDGRDAYVYTFKEMRRMTLQAVEVEFPDLGTHGPEFIERGAANCRNAPAIHYLNTGETYGKTVMCVAGRWTWGDWGTIVENGNYNRG
jgi:hypothetical protein